MEDYQGSHLKCTGCFLRVGFEDYNCSHIYTHNTTNQQAFSQAHYPRCDVTGLPHYVDSRMMSMLTSACWCLHCNRPTLVERIPDIDQYLKAAAWRRLPPEKRSIRIHDYLINMDDEVFLAHYQWRITRAAPPKCLRCGNSAYILIDENKRDTGITHEYCWNSPIECIPPHICSAEYRAQISCYHALSGDLNWLHLSERTVISCMTDDLCKDDLRKAAHAIVRYKETEAFDILEALSKENRPPAMTALGTLYLFGIGVEADGELAIHYLSKALKAGDGLAAMNLSRMYWAGMAGIKADDEKMKSYLHTAREMGIYIR